MKEGERQCPAIYATRGGVVFCVKPEGHEGDHRGFRAQWNDEERVKITELRAKFSSNLPNCRLNWLHWKVSRKH